MAGVLVILYAMKANPVGTFIVAIAVTLLGAAPAAAQEIYRWVDADGVVHFSDTAPATESSGIRTIVLEYTRPADYDPEADIYDVAGQSERMQALREDMAREREARRERDQKAARAEQPPVDGPAQYGYPVGYPLYPRPPMRPPARPPTGPQPPRPEPYETSTLRPPGQATDSSGP